MYISYHRRIFFFFMIYFQQLNAMKKVHKIICQKRLQTTKLHFQNKTREKD